MICGTFPRYTSPPHENSRLHLTQQALRYGLGGWSLAALPSREFPGGIPGFHLGVVQLARDPAGAGWLLASVGCRGALGGGGYGDEPASRIGRTDLRVVPPQDAGIGGLPSHRCSVAARGSRFQGSQPTAGVDVGITCGGVNRGGLTGRYCSRTPRTRS